MRVSACNWQSRGPPVYFGSTSHAATASPLYPLQLSPSPLPPTATPTLHIGSLSPLPILPVPPPTHLPSPSLLLNPYLPSQPHAAFPSSYLNPYLPSKPPIALTPSFSSPTVHLSSLSLSLLPISPPLSFSTSCASLRPHKHGCWLSFTRLIDPPKKA